MAWRRSGVNASPADGVGPGELESGDGDNLAEAMVSDDKLGRALTGPGGEGAGLPPWLAGPLGNVADVFGLNPAVGDDVVLSSAAAGGLVLPLLGGRLGAVSEPVMPADGLPAVFGGDEL
jgi:hypothetical protein